ncbi:hypothetical protein AB0P00_13635 [Microbacterium sp. NPDC077057]|uniref:hypothetical protein n=1 Tax=Microbacterium sp. NPDC077057 TaxID=3154763 RepID=UPI003433E93B
MISASDTEIIEFFREHEIEFEVDELNHQVESLEHCHQALRDQLAWAICDEEMIIEGELYENPDVDSDQILSQFYATLRSPKIAADLGREWFITHHRAAELLGTTVEAVVDDIDPSCFSEIRDDEQTDRRIIKLFREHFVVQDGPVDHRKPETIDECLEILQHRAAGISSVLRVSIEDHAANPTSAEIIEFFQKHGLELFDEDDADEYRYPKTVEECHTALRDQIQLVTGDDKELVFRAYYGALYDPSPGIVTHDFRHLHRAAALLGTTVEAELAS